MVPISHSLVLDVGGTQRQPLLPCSSPLERVNKKCLFRKPASPGSQNWAQIPGQTHREPPWVRSPPLPCLAWHSSAGKSRNSVHWRHPPCEFIPFPPDVIQFQRPRGFRRSREPLTCAGILALAEAEMIYKKSLTALPPGGFALFPLVVLR